MKKQGLGSQTKSMRNTKREQLQKALSAMSAEQLRDLADKHNVCYYTLIDISTGAIQLKGKFLDKACSIVLSSPS